MKKLLLILGFDVPLNNDILPTSIRTDVNSINMKEFTAWCKEFNVGVLSNKDNIVSVTVGDREKLVKLDRF